jgi:signal peptidase I
MTPTYADRELAFATKNIGKLKQGDIVLLETAKGTIVKRIAYLPGQWMELVNVFGDWTLIDSGVLSRIKRPERLERKMFRIPDEYLYVLGDNSTNSVDSRQLGVLPISAVRAKILSPKPIKSSPLATKEILGEQ